MEEKLRVSVNKNPTKEGIKVQFVLPETLEGDAKAEKTQELHDELNQGLQQYNLTVSQDTDVPYSNVIGFLIPIADIKLLIKKAIEGEGDQSEETPPAEPPKEEPIKEIKRMQKLAGILNENLTITKIEPGRDTGFAFGALGAGYKVTLSDGSMMDTNDDELLDRYKEIRDGRKTIQQLNNILVGKEWENWD